ncbi:MAG: hypothetical protein AAB506_01070 [Patescibacteria group bacterium]
MKILFLTEFFPTTNGGLISGGSESRTYYLAKQLSLKYNISVITCYLEGTLREESWGRLKIYRVGPKRNYVRKMSLWERGLFGLSAMCKTFQLRPNIIDANNGVVYIFGFLGKLITSAKLVYWVPDVVGLKEWQKEQGLLGGIIAWALESVIYWFPADQTIALSETTKKKMACTKNINVIYPGV